MISLLKKLTLPTLIFMLVALAIWRFFFYGELAVAEQAQSYLILGKNSIWAPFIVVAIYVLAGLVFFPVTGLLLGTALIFSPLEGFFYAILGVLTSATVGYLLGELIGAVRLKKVTGRLFSKITESSVDQGIMWVAIIRHIPIVSFNLANMIIGCSRITLRQLLLGTILGMAPSIALIMYLAQSFEEAFRSGRFLIVIPAILVALLFILIGAYIEKWFRRTCGTERNLEK